MSGDERLLVVVHIAQTSAPRSSSEGRGDPGVSASQTTARGAATPRVGARDPTPPRPSLGERAAGRPIVVARTAARLWADGLRDLGWDDVEVDEARADIEACAPRARGPRRDPGAADVGAEAYRYSGRSTVDGVEQHLDATIGVVDEGTRIVVTYARLRGGRSRGARQRKHRGLNARRRGGDGRGA